MKKSSKEVRKQDDNLYHRLMGSRDEEIARLKADRLAKQLHDREEGILLRNKRRKEIHVRFERFISACMQESLRRVAGSK